MHVLNSRFWKNFDWLLFTLAVLLVAIGLITIYSTSFKAADITNPANAIHQLMFAVLGLVALFATSRIDYRGWSKATLILYAVMIISLVAVLVVGKEVQGATRWIDFGFFQFQPSEFAKLIIILVLAKYFSANYDNMDHPRHIIISLAYVLIPVVLILLQPKLGDALVLMVIWLVMIIVARVRLIYLGAAAGAGLLAMPIILTALKPYQRARLESFVNPMADPLHAGYNVMQSTIAVGSGQLYGRGLAAGSQSQLNFLPSQHTDFIFAVLSEKMGFIGSMLVLLLFTALLLRGLQIAMQASDRFGMLAATGIVAMLLFHIFINIGMNVGLLPVTGIPLPLVSYGGTSLIISLAAIGLLESIAVRRKKIQFGV